ncbi:MAG: alpha/beta hydrolase family protein, partial [Phycisphaerales bacterium]
MSTRRSVIVLVAFLALAMVAPASQPAVSAPVSVKVSIAVPDTDVVLAGTLLLPAGATEEASVPGVLLVTGSGPQDRDETLMGVKPFKVLAEGLVAHGYAVLRYDDRGTQGLGIGQSTGSFAGSTTADFADDAAAAASFLAEQPAIDGSRVVVCGHSTGGLVTAKLLGRGEVPAAAVLLAAPSVIGWELLAYQSNKMVRETDKIQPTGLSDDQLDELDRVQTAVIKSVAVGTEEEQKEAARGAIAFNVGLAGGDLSEFTPEMMDAAIEQALAPLRDPWMA